MYFLNLEAPFFLLQAKWRLSTSRGFMLHYMQYTFLARVSLKTNSAEIPCFLSHTFHKLLMLVTVCILDYIPTCFFHKIHNLF